MEQESSAALEEPPSIPETEHQLSEEQLLRAEVLAHGLFFIAETNDRKNKKKANDKLRYTEDEIELLGKYLHTLNGQVTDAVKKLFHGQKIRASRERIQTFYG